jgi:hypothetical protein
MISSRPQCLEVALAGLMFPWASGGHEQLGLNFIHDIAPVASIARLPNVM